MDFQQMNALGRGYAHDPLDTSTKSIRESWALIPNEEYERLVFDYEGTDNLD
jgi:hypothetical protein